MLAKLNNLGPFAFFFTLSSADLRWDENFTTLLREKGWKIIYDIDGAKETTWVVKMNGNQEAWRKLLRDFLDEDADESFHELLRRNIMTATRNYKNRFDSFIKEIVTDKSNPMCIDDIGSLDHFYDFWIQKSHHFYYFWIQKSSNPFSQILDPETAVILQFLDP